MDTGSFLHQGRMMSGQHFSWAHWRMHFVAYLVLLGITTPFLMEYVTDLFELWGMFCLVGALITLLIGLSSKRFFHFLRFSVLGYALASWCIFEMIEIILLYGKYQITDLKQLLFSLLGAILAGIGFILCFASSYVVTAYIRRKLI